MRILVLSLGEPSLGFSKLSTQKIDYLSKGKRTTILQCALEKDLDKRSKNIDEIALISWITRQVNKGRNLIIDGVNLPKTIEAIKERLSLDTKDKLHVLELEESKKQD